VVRRRDADPRRVRRLDAGQRTAPPKTASGRRRPALAGLVLAAAIVTGAAFYAGVTQVRRLVDAARLPRLPDMAGQTMAIAEHLRERDRAARGDPASATTVGALCLAYHADMFYDQAERCYVRAEQLNRTDWRWTYYRALAEGERGSRGPLTADLRSVVEEAPEFGPAWWRLGEAEFKQAHYEQAAAAWRRAGSSPEPSRTPSDGSPEHVVGTPVSAYAALGLARVALVRGDTEQARQILEGVTSSAPRFGSAFRLLGDTYDRLGRGKDAEGALRRANSLPVYAPYADPLVDVLARDSRSSTFLLQQAAETDLNTYWDEYLTRRALEFDPANPDVVYKLGLILRTLGRNDEALALFERYRQMVPEDFQALGQIGSCLGDLGRFVEAESFLRRALTRVDDALTHYNLGFVLTRLDRLADAKVEYGRTLDRNPNHVQAHINLAAVLVRQGQLDQASRELGRTLEIEPENAAARTNLGLLLAQQGHLEQARREFQEALRINPQQREAQDALRALGR
jgi:tetratricopeptide (TPR) repeat protein